MKWSVGSFLVVVILTILSVELTGRMMSEERSDMGTTVTGSKNAVTYLKELDCSFETPKMWKRFFPDTGNQGIHGMIEKYGMQFAAAQEDRSYQLEIYADNIAPEQMNGMDNLADASEEQKEQFKTLVSAYLATAQTEEYTIEGDMTSSFYETDHAVFAAVQYVRKANTYKEYDAVMDYCTVIHGRFVWFSFYWAGSLEQGIEAFLPKVQEYAEDCLDDFVVGDITLDQPRTSSENGLWNKLKNFTFGAWVFLIPLLYIFLSDMEIAKEKNEWNDEVMDLSCSKSLLGFFALLIVMHHIVQQIGSEQASVFRVLEDFGICFVGAFFFFSGYGLMTSYHNKKDYLKGFFKKRFSSILIPFYVCNLMFLIVEIAKHPQASVGRWIGWITGFILLNTQMWYIVEIALLYTIFYVSFRFIRKENVALLVMGLFLTGFVIGSLLSGHGDYWFQGEWWYNATFVFFVGMLVSRYRQPIEKFLKKYYVPMLLFAIVLFILLYRVVTYTLSTYGYWTETADHPMYGDKLLSLCAQIPFVLSFLLLVLLVGMKVKWKNVVLDFLGKISLELYLIHNIFLQNLTGIAGSGMFIFSVFVCSIVAAAMLHSVDDRLLCKVFRRPYVREKMLPKIKQAWVKGVQRTKELLRFAKRHPGYAFRYIWREGITVLIAFVTVVPIYILFINSTRTSYSLVHGLSFLPEGHFMDNARGFLGYDSRQEDSILHAIRNSVIIAGSSCLLATYFGAMTAYGFELFKFKGKKILWCFVVATLAISPVTSVIGFYNLMFRLGWLNNFLPLIIPAIATPSTVFFMRMYLRTLHLNEIAEAGRIDGCSELGIFNRIILPAIKPAVSLQIIFTYVTSWNNSLTQTMILQERRLKTIAIYLRNMAGNKGASANPETFVMLLFATIPSLVVFVLFSKGIVSQIVLGAVKE